MEKYTALLIDLDGTLLDIEVSFFLGPMVEAMHECFRDLLEMEQFRDGLFGGTEAIMVEARNDGENNKDGFNQAFARLTGLSVGQFEDRFDHFYREVFPTLTGFGRPVDGALEFIAKAAKRGYALCRPGELRNPRP